MNAAQLLGNNTPLLAAYAIAKLLRGELITQHYAATIKANGNEAKRYRAVLVRQPNPSQCAGNFNRYPENPQSSKSKQVQ